MKDITPIRNDQDHATALAEIRLLWGAPSGSPAGDRLDVLMVLVDDFEAGQHAIEPPDPIEAILVRMEAMDLTRADLGKMLGVPSGRVSELLNRRRRLTIEMIRILAREMKLPAACLVQFYELAEPSRVAA